MPASATITGTVDRADLSATFTGRFAVGARHGVYLHCADGDWPAATYVLAMAMGDTLATAQLSRTAAALTGTLNLSGANIRDAWADGDARRRRAAVYLSDVTPRVWCAQPVPMEYVEDSSYA